MGGKQSAGINRNSYERHGHRLDLSHSHPGAGREAAPRCIHLTADERCDIHEIAPFGCAFFDYGPAPPGFGLKGRRVAEKQLGANGFPRDVRVRS